MNFIDNFILAALWTAYDFCKDEKKRKIYHALMKIVWCMAESEEI